jgi:hypothetical protein
VKAPELYSFLPKRQNSDCVNYDKYMTPFNKANITKCEGNVKIILLALGLQSVTLARSSENQPCK